MPKRKRIKIATGDYLEYVLMLTVLSIVSWYYYGGYALRLLFIGMLTAVAAELVCVTLMKRDRRCLLDFHAVFTGAAVAMMLPATAAAWLVMSGAAFAVLVAKIPFGSTLKTPFVPAAAAMAFLTVCFPSEVFLYPDIEALGGGAFERGVSLSAMLSAGGSQHLNVVRVLSIISGNIPGPMGAGCIAALAGCCAFFAILRPKKLCNVAGFVLVCAVLAVLFPRGSFSRMTSLLTELCAGSLLFSAVFFSTDPATSPKPPALRFFYGALMGALCMLMRYFGAFEEGTCFAVLLANALWSSADSALRKTGVYSLIEKRRRRRRAKKEAAQAKPAAVKGGAG